MSSTRECCVDLTEFQSAVTSLGYTPAPTSDQYHHFCNGVKSSRMSKDEAAMFLAQTIHESGGLKRKDEDMCPNERMRNYGRYHGRGYIQLTHDYNYRAASKALNLDLMSNPDKVLEEPVAWEVSFWFWKANVRPSLQFNFKFDVTTDAINGALEPKGNEVRDERKRKYEFVCKQLKVTPQLEKEENQS